MDLFIAIIDEFLNFDWNFIFSDKFWFYGILCFWIVVPCLVVSLVDIIIFFIDYAEFRNWRKEQDEKAKKKEI